MAACLRKLFRKSTSTRLISTLQNPNPTPLPLLHHQTLSVSLNPNQEKIPNFFLPFPGIVRAESFTQFQPPFIYPSFPFGSILNPICSSGSIQSVLEDNASEDSGTIWADSVKKKRKKKMNKHKYKKLRKRLRRKT